MTEKFVASNGVIVDQVPTTIGNRFVVQDVNPAQREGSRILSRSNWLDPRDADALREFFQQERDLELGRWRWPENPDYVVYPTNVSDRVRVMRETGCGDLEWVSRGDGLSYEFCHAARAYFAAHPEPKPEWHDAKPGEVWVANIRTGPTFDEVALQVREYFTEGIVFKDHIEDIHYPFTDPAIISARKIWPVSDV